MDRMIYTAMTGAKHILAQQTTVSHNLSNISTTGFRSQLDSFRALPVFGEGAPTRVYVTDSTVGIDFNPGTIHTTGRDLDIAINGKGWFAVRGPDGKEAYTRNGSLMTNANGLLTTSAGHPVLAGGATITIPPDEQVVIAPDGTISTVPTVGAKNQVTEVGRLKLVNPPEKDLVRGEDGLFHLANGGLANADDAVVVHTGAIETSNVNVADAMVSMITLARSFDMHMKLLQNAEQNAAKASQALLVNG